jgi:hypothetical protein
MTVDRPKGSSAADGLSLAVSDNNLALGVFIPNESPASSNNRVTVHWAGSLHTQAILDWAKFVLEHQNPTATLVVDIWNEDSAAPKSYSPRELNELASDLRAIGDATVTVEVCRELSDPPALYLWGDFSPENGVDVPKTESEVGLTLGVEELNQSPACSALAKMLEMSATQKFSSGDLESLLQKLASTVRHVVQSHGKGLAIGVPSD